MKFVLRRLFVPFKKETPPIEAASRLQDDVSEMAQTLSDLLNGQLTFGSPSANDNILGRWVTYTTNAVAGTEDSITHNLGRIPVGALVMVPPQSGVMNKGSSAWTTSVIFMKCSAAAQSVTLFIVSPPQQKI